MNVTAPPFGSALIGQTEKALNALLERRLTGTGLTESQWVTLTLTATATGPVDRAALIAHIHQTTRFPESAISAHLTELAATGFLTVDDAGRVSVTPEGRTRWTGIRTDLGSLTQGLWGDLPAEDLAVAERVLGTVLARAKAVLS
ncbi:winged helix DNA-binding protein [Actinocorallia herbida]|uniref:Winged helix DNA-binding protein n=1 Tax=Actinocorallia herbida TaxID=58109 RepID=A0A3N1D3Y8_9ACTN|nr:winged helix DNA-binding protein [Actinocorallia herbida]ROO88219.1 winged helix DNA-binding protein [Actinocorallia herbida]